MFHFVVKYSNLSPQLLSVARDLEPDQPKLQLGSFPIADKDLLPTTKDRREKGRKLRLSHLSRRSWQVVLRMSTTPSVLSCLHRMEVAMKQPVRPIPALWVKGWRGKGTERVENEKMDDQCIDLRVSHQFD